MTPCPSTADEGALRPKALRIDDVGASTKRYLVYSDWSWRRGPLRVNGNWLFLKYLPPFRKWGVYREMRADEWAAVFEVLRHHRARLTVAVTAAWADGERRLTPFPERFPAEAAMLRRGHAEGLLEIANHGLTHCVLAGDAFKPRWWSSNRTFHREFWEWVPVAVQDEHLRRSQDILQSYFGAPVVTLVPPGGVLCRATVDLALRHGLHHIVCPAGALDGQSPALLDDRDMLSFHDRDVVLKGVDWLTGELARWRGRRLCAVRDLAEAGVAVAARGEG